MSRLTNITVERQRTPPRRAYFGIARMLGNGTPETNSYRCPLADAGIDHVMVPPPQRPDGHYDLPVTFFACAAADLVDLPADIDIAPLPLDDLDADVASLPLAKKTQVRTAVERFGLNVPAQRSGMRVRDLVHELGRQINAFFDEQRDRTSLWPEGEKAGGR